MTRDEIMALEGRALDAAIAEKVCGMRKGEASSHWLDASGHRACGCAVLLPLTYENCDCPIGLIFGGALNLGGPNEWLPMAMADAATRCRAMLLALEAK